MSEEPSSSQWMFMDPYDSHLDARVDRDGLTVSCLHEDGFQYLWKGVRANYGVASGVYMYEVKILENLDVKMPETKSAMQHILRCGFSQPLTSLFLGDTAESWGWGGTGKKSTNNQFSDYASSFSVGDVIGCVVDMGEGTISFLKNGEFMGVAFDNIPPAASQTGIFPHLLMKNVKVKVNFRRETKWFDPPGSRVKFFEEANEDCCLVNPVDHPASISEAEFIMLCGLPACGKTYWAQKHMEANPRQNYVILGTNAVIDQMKVMNLNRMRNYADRWQELITQATPIFNKLVEIAGQTPRNVILDQTNVYQNARRRKAAAFARFGRRRCVTIVTDEETLAERTSKREKEEGKFVPVGAVNGMRANFAVPELQDGFTSLEWVELPEADAIAMIRDIRGGGKGWAQRNPGKGGVEPLPRLENRDPSAIGKGAWRDPKTEAQENGYGARDRSRTPPSFGKGSGNDFGKGSGSDFGKGSDYGKGKGGAAENWAQGAWSGFGAKGGGGGFNGGGPNGAGGGKGTTGGWSHGGWSGGRGKGK